MKTKKLKSDGSLFSILKTPYKIVQTTAAFFAVAVSGMYQNSYDISAGYSGTSNPNGVWSYGRKLSIQATAMNLLTVQWGANGWYLAGTSGWPSIQGGPEMWNENNGNGYCCDRWTCPTPGRWSINSQFYAADSRGVDNYVYVVTNGAIMFSNLIQSYPQSVSFSNAGVYLHQGDVVDFTLAWGGGVNDQYGWTGVGGMIARIDTPYAATAAAEAVSGYVVGATVTDPGQGYTNTPSVRFIGGGGSEAQAVAVVSNGVVTAVNIVNPGSGYTNTPLVVIAPPFIPNPVLSISPMTFLSFTNLNLGSVYQLQQWEGYYWSNQPVSFTATNTLYTQIVAGVANSEDYQLALSPVPAQAFATAQVVNGFVVGISLTSGGSGYASNPAVTIVGNGSNAVATASISGAGVVTNVMLINPGIGYFSGATVEIAPPPNPAVSPTVSPMMQLGSTSLSPYDNYQFLFTPGLGTAWQNLNGGLFIPTNMANTQMFFITNSTGFFLLEHL